MFFLDKRLVFMAGEAEAAISQVETDVKSKPEGYDAKTADQLVADAKGKLPTTLNPEDKKTAEGKIDFAKGKFESALALAKRAIKLKADVASVKADGDFLNAVEKINALKKERDALKTAGLSEDTSVAAKETEVNTAAEGFYGKMNKAVNDILPVPDFATKDFRALMAAVSQLEEAKVGKFPGLKEGADTSVYSKSIDAAKKKLDEIKKDVTDPEIKAELERFNFALINLEGAEKESDSKETGHLRGAQEYMGMVLAEQEARRLQDMIPESERKSDAYNAAMASFKAGLDLSVNRVAGDSTKAKVQFKDAANKFRVIVETQQGVEIEKAATAKKTKIETFLKDNAVTDMADAAQTAWAEGKSLFDQKKFKDADAKFQIVTAEVDRLEKGEYNGDDVARSRKAVEKAKADFETTYGSDGAAASVKSQADAIATLLNRSGAGNEYTLKINKDVARIYTEGGLAIAALNRELAAYGIYKERSGGHFDVTADVVYSDGKWRFDRGAFKEAAQKFNEAAAIYEAVNDGKVDRNKSNALIDGEVKEGTQEKANELKAAAEKARTDNASLGIGDLLAYHYETAQKAVDSSYWARAINQYQQAINMVNGAKSAAEIYNSIKAEDRNKIGTVAYDFIQQGNKYYNDGSFAEAKTYYQNAVKALRPKEVPAAPNASVNFTPNQPVVDSSNVQDGGVSDSAEG